MHVVDDESKDESGKILDEYASQDSRIRLIHQANKGEGGAHGRIMEPKKFALDLVGRRGYNITLSDEL